MKQATGKGPAKPLDKRAGKENACRETIFLAMVEKMEMVEIEPRQTGASDPG